MNPEIPFKFPSTIQISLPKSGQVQAVVAVVHTINCIRRFNALYFLSLSPFARTFILFVKVVYIGQQQIIAFFGQRENLSSRNLKGNYARKT
jgi:hypothetical protein